MKFYIKSKYFTSSKIGLCLCQQGLGKILITFNVFFIPVGRVLAYGPGDLRSIPVHVIIKTLKMVLDTSLLNTQVGIKVGIKRKMEQSSEKRGAPHTLIGVVAIEKGALWSPSTTVANFTYFYVSVFVIINSTEVFSIWHMAVSFFLIKCYQSLLFLFKCMATRRGRIPIGLTSFVL